MAPFPHLNSMYIHLHPSSSHPHAENPPHISPFHAPPYPSTHPWLSQHTIPHPTLTRSSCYPLPTPGHPVTCQAILSVPCIGELITGSDQSEASPSNDRHCTPAIEPRIWARRRRSIRDRLAQPSAGEGGREGGREEGRMEGRSRDAATSDGETMGATMDYKRWRRPRWQIRAIFSRRHLWFWLL